MNRGNTLIIKTIVIISFMLFLNISHSEDGSTKGNSEKNQDKTGQLKSPESKKLSEIKKSPDRKNTSGTLQDNSEIGVTNYIQMLFGLFAIVAFIFAVAWLIKRMGTLNPNHSSHLKIVAGISVGQREKIVVVQVMGEQLLVGITQSNIQLLNKLEKPIPEQGTPSLGGFQDKLQTAMKSFTNKTGVGERS